MGSWTFLELARKIIEEEKKPLSSEEIWNIALAKGYDKNVGSEGKTPWMTINAQLYVTIRDKKDSPFYLYGSRPRKFYLKNLPSPSEESKSGDGLQNTTGKKYDYLEHDLHPFVSYFGYYHLKAYLKTIQHSKSEKKEFGEWIHPDVVGCYVPINDWKTEVFEISSTIGNISVRLFSFEIKRELNFSNLRESFFQAVSNSSWANEGYLAASNILKDEEFRDELKRLSTSFGIGVIEINLQEPDSTEVLFSAKYKESLDWDMVNKLATMNSDFREFLSSVKNDVKIKYFRKEMYDKILSREDLIKSIKK